MNRPLSLVSLAAPLTLAVALGAPGTAAAQVSKGGLVVRNLCSSSVVPTADNPTVAAPAPGNVLARPPVYYIAGGQIDVSFTTPTCTGVAQVTYGGRVLSTQADPIEGGPFYRVISSTVQADGRVRITVRLYVAALGQGGSQGVQILVRNTLRLADAAAPTASFAFTRTDVRTAAPATMPVSYSEAELRDAFILGIWNRFGDAGEFTHVADNGDRTTLYDPNYDLDLTVTPEGVEFGWGFKIRKNNWFDPSASVHGVFRLSQAAYIGGGSSYIEWVEPPTGWIDSIFASGADEQKLADAVGRMVDEQVTGMVVDGCGDNCVVAITGFTHEAGEVQADMRVLGEGVTIDVPYRAMTAQGGGVGNVALRAGDRAILFAGDLANVCRGEDGLPGACNTLPTGPGGLINSAGNVPVLDDALPYGGWYGQRIEVAQALDTLNRRAETLLYPDDNVGLLLARRSTGGLNGGGRMVVGRGCQISASGFQTNTFAFGRNDSTRNGSERGSGTARLSLFFPVNGAAVDACPFTAEGGLVANPPPAVVAQ